MSEKDQFTSIDVGDDIRQFLKAFGIKKFFPIKKVTLEQRDDIEMLLTHMFIASGEEDTTDYYTLNYVGDMWYGCELCKLKKVGEHYYPEAICRGEGDTPTFALLALLIIMKNKGILDSSDISYIKSLF